MRPRRTATIQDLRTAIDCMPRDTRIAMLHGIRTNPIIVGAYADDDGICPMLAAHRAGGRTSFISFARAWDRFAFRDTRGGRARRATRRELLILRSHLEASLLEEDTPAVDLAAALAEHRELRGRAADGSSAAAIRPGEPDRSQELQRRPGWRWMRITRSLDDYERTLALLERERDAHEAALASVE